MKSLSAKLGVVLVGLAIFGYVEVWGADWKCHGETDDGTFFYDATSITHPSKNIVRVWTRIVFTEKGVIGTVGKFGSRFENLGHALNLWEFNCSKKMGRLLTTIYYSKNGEVMEDFKHDMATWELVPPASVIDDLYKAVCK